MNGFCHLHLHNEYSVLDGIGTSEQYAKIAKEAGQSHLALTNHGNVDGVIIHQKKCKEVGVKPLIGCELYVVPDLTVKQKGENRYHATVLVENEIGWQNLLRLLTQANLRGFYHRPRVDFDLLKEYLEGLVLLTGCSLSFLNLRPAGMRFLGDAIDILGEEKVFLEAMPHQIVSQAMLNDKLVRLSRRYSIKVIGTNDCHYPSLRSDKHQEVLLAIQTKKKMTDQDRWKLNVTGLHLRSEKEMADAFYIQNCFDAPEINKILSNTQLVAEICEGFQIKKQEPKLPCIGLAVNQTDMDKVREIVQEGFESRLLVKDDGWLLRYRNRIEEELALIENAKFERYFLIVWDLIAWCKRKDIMTGPGRGSVGGSLVAYLMGITDVDPIKYDLVFSRFISSDRIDLPDIDMDFEDHKRHLVREYLEQKYGKFNVAGLSTFMTMKGRGVFRDICRVYDIPIHKVDPVAKAIDSSVSDNSQIKEAFDKESTCIRFKQSYPEVVEAATALEGQIRGVGQHAAAVCISSEDLREGCNCNLSIRSGKIVANWDKGDSEYMGLIKLDILGLSALSILNETKAMVYQNHKKTINYNEIPLDDRKVFEQIKKGKTTGAFQIGARGLSKFCRQIKMQNFEDLVAATALYRPGPLHSGMAEKFIEIRSGIQPVKKIAPIYDDITKNTFGIIVYQEQVMSVINRLSGIDMSTCDKIRKLMAKSKGIDAINKYKQQFLEGCEKLKTVNKNQAQSIWETILTFGKYGFNKAHSVEYSLITYWDMWLKVYYPWEFAACCLTYGSKEQMPQYIKEARRLKLEFRVPKIGSAHATDWRVDKNGNLFIPFIFINGVGKESAEKIANYNPDVNQKRGFFKTTPSTVSGSIPGVNKTITAILEKIEAFSPVGEITAKEKILVRELLEL